MTDTMVAATSQSRQTKPICYFSLLEKEKGGFPNRHLSKDIF